MIKFLFRFSLSFSLLLLSVSFIYSSENQIELARVANYSLKPQRAFLIKNKLFLDYGSDNLFLTLKLPKKYKSNEIKRLKLDAEKIKNKDIKEITILSDEIYQKVINQAIVEFGISKNNTVLKYTYESELGTIKNIYDEFNVQGNIPKDQNKFISDIQKDKKTLDDLFKSFINIVIKYTGDNKQFIILSKNMPNIIYLYIDVERSLLVPLILPPYQKSKSELKPVSIGIDYLYSFIIINHAVPIIKSPFTSAYRLFSNFSSSLLGFAPNISEEYYFDCSKGESMMNIKDFNSFLDEELGTKEYKARVNFLIDGEEFFTDFVETAKKAEHSIFIQTYIFKTDEFSIRTAEFLKQCSKTSDVRVLIDSLGVGTAKSDPEDIVPPDYNPPDSIIKFLKESSNVKVRTHPDTWLTFDHRKVFIVDRQKAYIGGMNIANEYRYIWHDLMVSLEGPIVSKIVKNFYKAWSFAGLGGDFAVIWRSLFTKSRRDITKPESDMVDVRLLTTSSTDYQIYDAQLEAVRRSKNRIYIENPYFSEKTLVEELILAKQRGVDVRIILPGVNDIILLDKINLKIANYLIENGIAVYLYPKMTHVKAAVFDNWACLGSANFNVLSMFRNREINIAFYDEKLVNELIEKLFIKDFEISKKYKQPVEIPLIYYLI